MDSFECINYHKLGVRHVFFREEKLDWYDNVNVFNLLFVSQLESGVRELQVK